MLYGFAFSVRSAIVNLVEVQLAVFLILIFNKALRHTRPLAKVAECEAKTIRNPFKKWTFARGLLSEVLIPCKVNNE